MVFFLFFFFSHFFPGKIAFLIFWGIVFWFFFFRQRAAPRDGVRNEVLELFWFFWDKSGRMEWIRLDFPPGKKNVGKSHFYFFFFGSGTRPVRNRGAKPRVVPKFQGKRSEKGGNGSNKNKINKWGIKTNEGFQNSGRFWDATPEIWELILQEAKISLAMLGNPLGIWG